MPYETYEQEAEAFLKGDYLVRPPKPTPDLGRHLRILGSVSRDVLKQTMVKNREINKGIDALLGLDTAGRRKISPDSFKSLSLGGDVYYQALESFLRHQDTFLAVGLTDMAELPAAVLSNSILGEKGRRLKFSRQLLRDGLRTKWDTFCGSPEAECVPWSIQYSPLSSCVDNVFRAAAGLSKETLITTNLFDFLLSAQEGACTFGSCHSLDGDHGLGNVSYALSGFTALGCVLGDVQEFPFHKLGRQWISVLGQGSTLLFGKRYGTFEPGLAKGVRDYLQALINPEVTWHQQLEYYVPSDRLMNIGHRDQDGHSRYPAYFDLGLACYSSWLEDGDVTNILMYPSPPCLNCGRVIPVTTASPSFKYLRCTLCGPWEKRLCDNGCGRDLDTTGNRDVGGATWCMVCWASGYALCHYCRAWAPKETSGYTLFAEYRISTQDQHWVCPACVVARKCPQCSNCLHPMIHDPHWIASEQWCRYCWANSYPNNSIICTACRGTSFFLRGGVCEPCAMARALTGIHSPNREEAVEI